MDEHITHLGDGAYATLDGHGGVMLTANSHDLQMATDRVFLDKNAVKALLEFVKSEKVNGS